MAKDLILKSTSIDDKRPTPSQLEIGEISLGYNEAGAFLCCKDTAGNIQQVGGIRFNEDAPGTPVKGTLWLKPSTFILYGFDGEYWLPVASGGGGGGSGAVSEIIAGDGIDVTPTPGIGVVTLNTDIDGERGIEIVGGRLAINPGIGLQFDGSGALAVTNQAMVYGGTADLTSSTAQPSNPSNGKVYTNTTSGTSNSVWAPDLIVGTSVEVADLVVWNSTTGKWDFYPTGSAGVNVCDLSIANRTATSLDIDSSTGADATVPAASQSQAGLMSAADKNLLDNTWQRNGTTLSPQNTEDNILLNGIVEWGDDGYLTVNQNSTLSIGAHPSSFPSRSWGGFISLTGRDKNQINSGTDNRSLIIDGGRATSGRSDGNIWFDRGVSSNSATPQALFEGSTGNFLLGGTLPSSPNITLNSDGSAQFKGAVVYQNTSAPGGTDAIKVKDGSSTVFRVYANGETVIPNIAYFGGNTKCYADGNVDVGGSLVVGQNSTLAANGSADFGGNVECDGRFDASGADANQPVFIGRNVNTETVRLTAGGIARFAGQVLIGGNIPSAPNITLNNTGSATFAGRVTTNDHLRSDRTGSTEPVFIGRLNGTETLRLVADGSASFKSNAVNIDNAGRLLVGTSVARLGNVSASFQQEASNSGTARYAIIGRQSGVPNIYLGYHGGTSAGQTTLVADNVNLGTISFNGADGTDFRIGATIGAVVDGTPSFNKIPTSLTFNTSETGSNLERMRIKPNGNVLIGGTLPSSPNIELNADGSAQFTDRVESTNDLAGTYNPTNSNQSETNFYVKNLNNSTNSRAAVGFSIGTSGTAQGVINLVSESGGTGSAFVFQQRKGAGSTHETLRINSNGNVLIGGTLPSSPNIELNNDGSAEFGGGRFTISGGGKIAQNVVAGTTGTIVDLKNDGTSVFQVLPSGYTKIGGGNIELNSDGSATFAGAIVGDRTSGSNSIIQGKLSGSRTSIVRADGSAEFAGDLTLGSGTTTDERYLRISTKDQPVSLELRVNDNTDFLIENDAGGNLKVKTPNADLVTINSNASATFAGSIYANSTIRSSRTSGTSSAIVARTGTTDTFMVTGDGRTRIGGTLPSSPNIDLNSNGSATFAGRISSSNAFQSDRTTASNSILTGRLNGTENVNITANGAATFAGVLDANGLWARTLTPADKGFRATTTGGAEVASITGDGAAYFANNVSINNKIELDSNGSTVFKGYTHEFGAQDSGGPKYISINSGGSATNYGYALRNRPAIWSSTSNTNNTNFGVGTTGSTFSFRVASDWTSTSTVVASINGDGSATFGGNVVSGSDPSSSINNQGIVLQSRGTVTVNRSSGAIFQGYQTGTTGVTSLIEADGSAQFAGSVLIGGTLPSSPNIELNASGSAEFGGLLSAGPIDTSQASASALGVSLSPGGLVRVQRPSNASSNTTVFEAYNGSTSNISLYSGGSATFAGDVTSGAWDGSSGSGVGSTMGSAGAFYARRAAGSNATKKLFGGFNGTDQVANIDATGGAQFAGSVSIGGTANANRIDEYERGVWTPVPYGATTAGTLTATTVQAGNYVRVGNICTVWCGLQVGLSGAAGQLRVGGLPFTANFSATGTQWQQLQAPSSAYYFANSGFPSTANSVIAQITNFQDNVILIDTSGLNPASLDASVTQIIRMFFTISYYI